MTQWVGRPLTGADLCEDQHLSCTTLSRVDLPGSMAVDDAAAAGKL